MAQIEANGITLEYDEQGPGSGVPILLIMGLGSQMTRWPAPFLDLLSEAGHRVIRFDNRDVGLSSRFDHAGAPNFGALLADLGAGKTPQLAYTLDDMAADAVGLLDALAIERAHLVGVSMGGMIGQLVTADYPDRVLSFTSIMSTTGNRALPRATDAAQKVLMTPAPDPATDLEGFLDRAVQSSQVIGSPGYPVDPDLVRKKAAADAQRAYTPLGFARQYAAILCAGDRREKLATIRRPVEVIHGRDDPLVPVEGGEDTARAIPGAGLEIIDGMGHDIPPGLYDRIAAGIRRAVERAAAEV
ncbi:alpha/beta fold hydrolase [Maricaulis maris]|uniref:alpha/beta fold hydrolase n=1 Tax=Maricaulis maris TaxID=74318 RepID=UPI00291F0483|nr:alpha/beta hydrolase [Maricaulis maris]